MKGLEVNCSIKSKLLDMTMPTFRHNIQQLISVQLSLNHSPWVLVSTRLLCKHTFHIGLTEVTFHEFDFAFRNKERI